VRYAQHEHTDFSGASLQALATPQLQTALGRLGDTLAAGNRAAMPESDTLRDRARQIKDETLARLDELLVQVETAVTRAGGHVHWASDAEAARRCVLEIARPHAVRQVIKSKSMTSEEIHLNPALEAAGIEVVESDLGEYIAQLARERPSHLVAPIIHKTIEQVAEVLSRAAGRPLPAEAKTLAATARALLREKFRSAEMGITGANFVVAETGTICIISNEGNARLTTTMPPIHVAIAGIEKLIPRLADLPVFLKLLARAATGQKMSVYTSLISGPRRSAEQDGPREFHLILLDNGRSRILGTPYRESLYCIRCGACLNACPVYRKVGGHAYGGVYAGPIGAVLTPIRDGLHDFPLLPQASSLCGACQGACPLKIQIPHMLVHLRQDLNRQSSTHEHEHTIYGVWQWGLSRPRWYRFGVWLATRLLGGRRGGWFRWLPAPFSGWTQARDFPTPARRSFHERWPELHENQS
jgi:L-lactate dehydrogenase complex protein LldF